jgi:5-formyltetrahydrofolate cyclo-ligase
MEFLKVNDYDKMRPNKWGIPEPGKGAEQISSEELDLVVIPGVAFSRNGCRLGFGQGFYDRLLKKLRLETMTVGFAYSFQVQDKFSCTNHDQKVKRIVTEQGFLEICP